jgi:hypothetical protein
VRLTKLYLARVVGRFPSAAAVSKMHLQADGRYCVSAPLRMLDARLGVHAVDWSAGSSASTTLLRLLSYDARSDTSVLSAQPLTGRTHQIRLHCEWVGHAIANDPLYGPGLFEGNSYKPMHAHPDAAVAARDEASGAWSASCSDCAHGKYYRPPAATGQPQLRYATHIWLHALSLTYRPAAVAAAEEGAVSASDAGPSSSAASASASAPSNAAEADDVSRGFSFSTAPPAWAAADFDVLKERGALVQSTPRASLKLQQLQQQQQQQH